MGVDQPVPDMDAATVRLQQLGKRLREEIDHQRRSYRAVAAAIGINDGHLNRIMAGQIANLAIEMVRRIEDELGLDNGLLLRAGGYVVDASDLRSHMRRATDLTPGQRQSLIDLYDALSKKSDRG
ncbi:MAG TPA: helix-turn-helix transcriptional regulator [Acidimicrobiales bacterium]|nr:helix-turn-helix transcriptional regulator [Acidimicrobiales bacterium]